ncbi:hypothetical protein KAR91_14930 [Candidatus Pacearchaeota archaeon]|nr:hypothetical protein [Candidatus Pacearchaeota archaeon]
MDISNEELKVISNLATRQLDLENEIKALQDKVKIKTESLKKVQEDLLPEAMAEIGLEEFTLSTGEKVSIKTGIAANISKANMGAAFGWLKKHGHDDIIKNEYKVPFGRGEEEQSKALGDFLMNHGYQHSQKRGVHHSTLRAFCNEQMEKGVNIPQDVFGIFKWAKSIVKK